MNRGTLIQYGVPTYVHGYDIVINHSTPHILLTNTGLIWSPYYGADLKFITDIFI